MYDFFNLWHFYLKQVELYLAIKYQVSLRYQMLNTYPWVAKNPCLSDVVRFIR